MKKVYRKPEIMFESFASSVNIAGDCEKTTNTSARGNCGVEWDLGETLFLDHMVNVCTGDYVVETRGDDGWLDLGPNNRLCYHVPDEEFNLFNS